MELRHELVAIAFRQRQECAAHTDEFDFIDRVSQSSQLFYASSTLLVWIVARSNSSHRGWLDNG